MRHAHRKKKTVRAVDRLPDKRLAGGHPVPYLLREKLATGLRDVEGRRLSTQTRGKRRMANDSRRVGWTEAGLEVSERNPQSTSPAIAHGMQAGSSRKRSRHRHADEFANRGRWSPSLDDQAIRELFLGSHITRSTERVFISLRSASRRRDLARRACGETDR